MAGTVARLFGELALVRGRVDTSARILQRAGFTGFGQQRSYAFTT